MNISDQPVQVPWALADVETLSDMWTRGYSATQIGKRLSRTRNSVLGRLHRMGLLKGNGPSPPKGGSRRTKSSARLASVHIRSNKVAAVVPVEPAPVVANPPKPFEELGRHECRYAVAEADGHLFSAAPVTPGRPYCPDHLKLCCVPVLKTERKPDAYVRFDQRPNYASRVR